MKPYNSLLTLVALSLFGISAGKAANPADPNLTDAEYDDRHYADFEYVEQHNPWLTSHNGALLRLLPAKSASEVTLSGTKSNGDFKNYSESDDSYRFGLATQSYYTLGKASLYGKIGYDNFMGQHMTGSAFIDPYSTPFNIVEFSDANSGRKNKETYAIAAGIGYSLSRSWQIGGRFDYTATNYTKRRDLRHTNTRLDMDLSLGLSHTFGSGVGIGANYLYSRDIEEMQFQSFGTTDQKYYVLVTPGAFYGNREQFGGDGYTSSSNVQPLFNKYHGASAQLVIDRPKFSAYYQFTYRSREGYYGLKHSPYYPVLTEHNSDIFENEAFLAFKGAHATHSLKGTSRYEQLENYENVYESTRDESGVYRILYYGRNRNSAQENLSLTGEYRVDFDTRGYRPTLRWSLIARSAYLQRNVTSSIYPFYRDQKIKQLSADIALHRTFYADDNVFLVRIRGGYAKGGGFATRDGVYATPSASTAAPQVTDVFLNREFEYFTAPRMTGSVGARYTRLFSKSINAYVDFSYDFTSAKKNKIQYLGGNFFNAFNLTLGCTF